MEFFAKYSSVEKDPNNICHTPTGNNKCPHYGYQIQFVMKALNALKNKKYYDLYLNNFINVGLLSDTNNNLFRKEYLKHVTKKFEDSLCELKGLKSIAEYNPTTISAADACKIKSKPGRKPTDVGTLSRSYSLNKASYVKTLLSNNKSNKIDDNYIAKHWSIINDGVELIFEFICDNYKFNRVIPSENYKDFIKLYDLQCVIPFEKIYQLLLQNNKQGAIAILSKKIIDEKLNKLKIKRSEQRLTWEARKSNNFVKLTKKIKDEIKNKALIENNIKIMPKTAKKPKKTKKKTTKKSKSVKKKSTKKQIAKLKKSKNHYHTHKRIMEKQSVLTDFLNKTKNK